MIKHGKSQDNPADVIPVFPVKPVEYPSDHQVGMQVPPGGSNCMKCEYLHDAMERICGSSYYISCATAGKVQGSAIIPLDPNHYCCDFFKAAEGTL